MQNLEFYDYIHRYLTFQKNKSDEPNETHMYVAYTFYEAKRHEPSALITD